MLRYPQGLARIRAFSLLGSSNLGCWDSPKGRPKMCNTKRTERCARVAHPSSICHIAQASGSCYPCPSHYRSTYFFHIYVRPPAVAGVRRVLAAGANDKVWIDDGADSVDVERRWVHCIVSSPCT